jgi:hypothetical protein
MFLQCNFGSKQVNMNQNLYFFIEKNFWMKSCNLFFKIFILAPIHDMFCVHHLLTNCDFLKVCKFLLDSMFHFEKWSQFQIMPKKSILHWKFSLYYKLQPCLIYHVYYTQSICDKKLLKLYIYLKIWSFKIQLKKKWVFFFSVPNNFYHLSIFYQNIFIIWILFIILYKIVST